LTYSATGLPDGLSIDPSAGIISGTLTDEAISATPYSLTVTASDGNGQSISQTFSWIISAPPLTAQGVAISATEGQDPGSITVATFTTPDLNSAGGDFTATVNWGDGNSDTGTVSGSNGNFTVTDDHVYAEKGTYTVTVLINNSITGASAMITPTATVSDAALNLTGGFQLGDPMTDQPTVFTVATFTDANPNAPSSDYSVNITWGDNTGSSGSLVSGFGGIYIIQGHHTYANPYPQVGPVTNTVTITLTDTDGASATTTSTVVVGAIAAGVPATMSNWLFQDQNPTATLNDFIANGQTGVALINWGDGTTSLGTVSGGPGNGNGPVNFTVTAPAHTYLQDSLNQPNGQYVVTETVTDTDGSILTGTQYVSVVRPPMAAWANEFVAQPGVALTNVQTAAFAVPNATDPASEFSATTNWGDGNTSAGTIQQVCPGLFEVLGSHTYAVAGLYPTLVTISQGWLAQLSAAAVSGLAQSGALSNIWLNSVSFSKGTTLQADNTFTSYKDPHWLDNNLNGQIDLGQGDHQYPYSYVSGSKTTVTAIFRPRKGFLDKAPDQIKVKGAIILIPGDPAAQIFKDPFPELVLDKEGNQNPYYSYSGSEVNKLPEVTEGVPDFDIIWQYSTNNGASWLPAGRSSNHVYLTYKSLTSGFVTHKLQTVFAFAASDVSAFNDNEDPIVLLNDIIWFRFSDWGDPANPSRVRDGKPLAYYKDWKTPYLTYYNLVKNLDGQCFSWSGLLAAVMAADGLNNVNNWTIYRDTIVPTGGYSRFLVKEWKFTPEASGAIINFYKQSDLLQSDHYMWLPTPKPDAREHIPDGIPGQNQKNPASYFVDHSIVELDRTNAPAAQRVILYDPSYGKMYQERTLNDALTDLQKAAIAGFGKTSGPATRVRLDITPNKNLPLRLAVQPPKQKL
jgi:hypothetical protein